MKYLITPLNEGQNLNYTEIFKGTFEFAQVRAIDMKIILQATLRQGTILVKIENEACTKEWIV